MIEENTETVTARRHSARARGKRISGLAEAKGQKVLVRAQKRDPPGRLQSLETLPQDGRFKTLAARSR